MASIASTGSASRVENPVAWGHVALVSLATVVTAVIANVIVYFLGDALIGYDPDFLVLADVGATIMFTLFFAVCAVLVHAAVLRLTRHHERVFTIIAGIAFVVTLIPDLTYIPTVEGASNAQTAILILMHVVAAAIIVPMLTRLAGPHHE